MSMKTMIAEMRGVVPGYSALLARIHLHEAWDDIRNLRGWFFQLGQGGLTTPSAISAGTVTVTFGSPSVTLDSTAAAAVIANGTQYGSLITQRQFRVGASTIYSIIAFDNVNTLTLDRPWTDLTSGVGHGYTIYQCYYPTPVKNFYAWEGMWDVTNVQWINTDPSKSERQRINRADPQRQIFAPPGTLLAAFSDSRLNSSTLGYMLYELYPQPISAYCYQTWYSWGGPDVYADADEVPYPMNESTLKSLARVKAYEWAEANKDESNPRGRSANYQFLMGEASATHAKALHEIQMKNRDLVDIWKTTMTRLSGLGPLATFNPSTGTVMSRNL